MFKLYDSLQGFKEKENSAVWAIAQVNQNRLKNVYFKKLCGVLNTKNSTNIKPFFSKISFLFRGRNLQKSTSAVWATPQGQIQRCGPHG